MFSAFSFANSGISRIFAQKCNDMTQILVTIDESTTAKSIRQAIGMLKGVVSTSLYNAEKSASKKKAQETYVKDSLGRAFDEIKQKECSNANFQSLDDFLMEC